MSTILGTAISQSEPVLELLHSEFQRENKSTTKLRLSEAWLKEHFVFKVMYCSNRLSLVVTSTDTRAIGKKAILTAGWSSAKLVYDFGASFCFGNGALKPEYLAQRG